MDPKSALCPSPQEELPSRAGLRPEEPLQSLPGPLLAPFSPESSGPGARWVLPGLDPNCFSALTAESEAGPQRERGGPELEDPSLPPDSASQALDPTPAGLPGGLHRDRGWAAILGTVSWVSLGPWKQFGCGSWGLSTFRRHSEGTGIEGDRWAGAQHCGQPRVVPRQCSLVCALSLSSLSSLPSLSLSFLLS